MADYKYDTLHTVASLGRNTGGAAPAVLGLCQALALHSGLKPCLLSQGQEERSCIDLANDHGAHATVKNINREHHDRFPHPGPLPEVEGDQGRARRDFHGNAAYQVEIAEARSRVALSLGWEFRALLANLIENRRPRLIHDNGLWLPVNHHVVSAARRSGIPLIVNPHGALGHWAIRHHRRRKALALRLYARSDLESAALFVVASSDEAEGVRQMGLKQPLALVPGGVSLPVPGAGEKVADDRQGGARNVVFLGRVHPVKNLLNLVKAWARLQRQDWTLQIVGPDEGGHLAEVLRLVRALGLEETVSCPGPVGESDKKELFAGADLLVLPSFAESFGLVVVEALAHGVPVITTRGTPWKGLVEHGCGWWVEPTEEALVEALTSALKLDGAVLRAMGARGREYVQEFEWRAVAEKTADVYRWVLGEGPRPGCVVVD